jgi:hypothetical protein
MSSTGSELVPLRAGARGGAALSLALPEGAVRSPDEALPAVDLSNLPGGRLAARRAYRAGAEELRAICVAAPAGGWAPGIEEIVLGRATQLARDALGGDARLTAAEPLAANDGFAQRFVGTALRDGVPLAVQGRHWLGFAGEPREGILCTVVCTEPAPLAGCDHLIAATAPEGAWLAPPPPNLLARTLLLAAERPSAAAAVFLAVALAVAALIIARRPRPRAL